MSKNKPTEVGQGLAALLGTSDPQSPSVETVETPDERAVRLAAVLTAIDEVSPADQGPDMEALQAEADARQQDYDAAETVLRQAEKTKRAAEKARDKAAYAVLNANPRSEQELNAEYIQAQIDERAQRATEASIRFEAAKRTGLFTDDELARMAPGASPLTQMIQKKKILEKRSRDFAPRGQ